MDGSNSLNQAYFDLAEPGLSSVWRVDESSQLDPEVIVTKQYNETQEQGPQIKVQENRNRQLSESMTLSEVACIKNSHISLLIPQQVSEDTAIGIEYVIL